MSARPGEETPRIRANAIVAALNCRFIRVLGIIEASETQLWVI
jgi:hypothetical protein